MPRTTSCLFSIPVFVEVFFIVGFIFQSDMLLIITNILFGIGMMTGWMFYPNFGGEIIDLGNKLK